MGHPQPLFVYFCLFKQTLQFSQQINVKNVNPVYSAGIRTHNQSPPITTRPGLPPKTHNVWINFWVILWNGPEELVACKSICNGSNKNFRWRKIRTVDLSGWNRPVNRSATHTFKASTIENNFCEICLLNIKIRNNLKYLWHYPSGRYLAKTMLIHGCLCTPKIFKFNNISLLLPYVQYLIDAY